MLLHSLPFLALIGWQTTPVDIPKAIPIELVMEQPRVPAPTPPAPAAKPPPIRSASADLAEVAAPKVEPGADSKASTQAKGEPSAESKTTTAAPTPPPESASSEVQAPTGEVETKTAALTPPLPPRPAPHKQQPSPPVVSAWPLPLHQEQPHEPRRLATLIGPAAVRDEYCVRALNLTLRHLDLLPLSFLGGRRGRTVLTIRILGDGTLNSVRLAEGSGYPDIDQRIQRMVLAVGQYPPLPPRMPGTEMDFSFIMVFPDPAER